MKQTESECEEFDKMFWQTVGIGQPPAAEPSETVDRLSDPVLEDSREGQRPSKESNSSSIVEWETTADKLRRLVNAKKEGL